MMPMDKYISIEKMTAEQIQAKIDAEFASWEHINAHGCSDPAWADGFNMNLVRNHIIYYYGALDTRQADTVQVSLFDEALTQRRPLPPEVSDAFMARPDELLEGAHKTLDAMLGSEDYAYLQSLGDMLPDKVAHKMHFGSFMAYPQKLKAYLDKRDYPRLRSYQDSEYWIKAISSYRERIDEEIYNHAKQRRRELVR